MSDLPKGWNKVSDKEYEKDNYRECIIFEAMEWPLSGNSMQWSTYDRLTEDCIPTGITDPLKLMKLIDEGFYT